MSDAPANPPPPMLDNARVLWWAWSGETPFGELFGAPENERWVHGFAVCRYDKGGPFYRFSCTREWEVVQDRDHDSEEDAKTDIPSRRLARPVAALCRRRMIAGRCANDAPRV